MALHSLFIIRIVHEVQENCADVPLRTAHSLTIRYCIIGYLSCMWTESKETRVFLDGAIMRNTYRCCYTITMTTLCDKPDDEVLRILVCYCYWRWCSDVITAATGLQRTMSGGCGEAPLSLLCGHVSSSSRQHSRVTSEAPAAALPVTSLLRYLAEPAGRWPTPLHRSPTGPALFHTSVVSARLSDDVRPVQSFMVTGRRVLEHALPWRPHHGNCRTAGLNVKSALDWHTGHRLTYIYAVAAVATSSFA